MTVDEEDALLRRLKRLPAIEPDAARAERVRAGARATLERRRQRAEMRANSPRATRRVLEPALMAGFCVSYLFALILDAIG